MKRNRTILIKVDKPAPTREQIRQHKNFAGFVNQFYRLHTPAGFRWMLKNNMKKLVFIIIIAVILLLWFLGEF